MKRTFLPVLLALFILASCTGDPPAATVVMEENTAVPTLTAAPLPTDTPPPTATTTPEPTPTFTPTALPPSPAPTETPPPTDVPTSTPEPTMPPTVAPTVPPLPTPTSAPPTPAVDTAAVLRQQIADVIAELGDYFWAIAKPFGLYINPTAAIDCHAIVNSHDRIVSTISVDVSGSNSTVQNAFATALQGVDLFEDVAGPWTESCRQALAMGSDTNIMGHQQYAEMMKTLAGPEALWNQAIHMLDE